MKPKKKKWHPITISYDGRKDVDNVKLCYTKNINGIDYHVCEQNGKIISKTPISEITWE